MVKQKHHTHQSGFFSFPKRNWLEGYAGRDGSSPLTTGWGRRSPLLKVIPMTAPWDDCIFYLEPSHGIYFWRSILKNKAEIPIKTRVIWVLGACLNSWFFLMVNLGNGRVIDPEWFHHSDFLQQFLAWFEYQPRMLLFAGDRVLVLQFPLSGGSQIETSMPKSVFSLSGCSVLCLFGSVGRSL